MIDDKFPRIDLSSLVVEERSGAVVEINIDKEIIRQLKVKYGNFLSKGPKVRSNDWLDFI